MSNLRLALLSSAFVLAACADKGSDSGSSTDSGSADAGSGLDGSWASACYNNTQTVLTYDGTNFGGTYTEYNDAACTDAYHVSAWGGTASFGDILDNGARQLDLAFLSFTSLPLTEENATMNNEYAYCGFTDWEAGVEEDVLGADCYGFSIPEGGVSLDIYKVEGDSLLFGVDAKIGVDLTEADRPTELDEMRVFTRVSGG
jgi:hypothetical protein